MDDSAATVEALHILNTLHTQFMELLTETLDASEDGIQAVEGITVGLHFVQSSVTIMRALKRCTPDVRARLRAIAPQTRFVYGEEGA
jgi:hypothetical protein